MGHTTARKTALDCGATTHMINDATKFKTVDKSFRPKDHMIELADGTKVSGTAKMRGDAEVCLLDSETFFQSKQPHPTEPRSTSRTVMTG